MTPLVRQKADYSGVFSWGSGQSLCKPLYDDIRELTAFLQPYMDLMSFDVRAISQLDYNDRVSELRTVASG